MAEVENRFGRLIMVRNADGNPQGLVQRTDGGLIIFPGGHQKPGLDSIDSLVEECREEGRLTPGQARALRNYELFYGAVPFQVYWGRQNVDECYVILSTDKIFLGLGEPNDPEIITTAWEELATLARGIAHLPGRVPENVRVEAVCAVKVLPEVIKLYSSY